MIHSFEYRNHLPITTCNICHFPEFKDWWIDFSSNDEKSLNHYIAGSSNIQINHLPFTICNICHYSEFENWWIDFSSNDGKALDHYIAGSSNIKIIYPLLHAISAIFLISRADGWIFQATMKKSSTIILLIFWQKKKSLYPKQHLHNCCKYTHTYT